MLPPHTIDDTLRQLSAPTLAAHPPRILVLYGSLRERSYSLSLIHI